MYKNHWRQWRVCVCLSLNHRLCDKSVHELFIHLSTPFNLQQYIVHNGMTFDEAFPCDRIYSINLIHPFLQHLSSATFSFSHEHLPYWVLFNAEYISCSHFLETLLMIINGYVLQLLQFELKFSLLLYSLAGEEVEGASYERKKTPIWSHSGTRYTLLLLSWIYLLFFFNMYFEFTAIENWATIQCNRN